MKQNIVFFGSGWFVIPVIQKLKKFNLQLVVTNESNGKVVEFCRDNNIPFVSSNLKDDETIEKIKSLKPTIAILASYGAFIPNEIIGLFENGIINIHPSLLPRWKGPSPVPYALLNGDTNTGVTIIKLDDEIDHGPILSQKPYELQGNETSEYLLSILFEIGSEMVVALIQKLENGETITQTQQDHNKETWSYKIEKKDGMIDILNPPDKEKLNNMIRALYPWPGVWFRYSKIAPQEHLSFHGGATSSSVPSIDNVSHSKRSEESKLNNKIIKLLPENRIQVEGKKPMSYKDFSNGFGNEGKEILEKLGFI
jgi:methionyl-tRNA formyltransferase